VVDILRSYQDNQNITHFDLAVDWAGSGSSPGPSSGCWIISTRFWQFRPGILA